MNSRAAVWWISGFLAAWTCGCGLKKDVDYVTTPQSVVRQMLRLAEIKPHDVVYDLGSGDGRVVITAAAEHGARGVGIEIDPKLVARARENARLAGVADRVEFREADLFQSDFSEATVVTLYLLPKLNLELRPKILAMRPGTRVVSYRFDMKDWKPDRQVSLGDDDVIYLWVVPERQP
jgi:SAM-dependent methyltransferase